MIILDGTVTWHVRVLGEASDLELDLGEASVDLITIDGGATDLTMSLSEPADNTFVGLHGGVRDARIHLPRGTNAAVSVRGDARDLVLDWQEWESTRDVEWRTRGWESARVRYVFELSGGITDLRLQFSS